jgi:hypothetical protein
MITCVIIFLASTLFLFGIYIEIRHFRLLNKKDKQAFIVKFAIMLLSGYLLCFTPVTEVYGDISRHSILSAIEKIDAILIPRMVAEIGLMLFVLGSTYVWISLKKD